MGAEDVKQLLLLEFPEATVNVTGEDSNFSVDIISADFQDVSRLDRQKKILSCVKEQITSGEIHAFSVQAYTAEEYRQANSLNVL